MRIVNKTDYQYFLKAYIDNRTGILRVVIDLGKSEEEM